MNREIRQEGKAEKKEEGKRPPVQDGSKKLRGQAHESGKRLDKLSLAEENRLLRAARQGDSRAMMRLLEQYEPLLLRAAHQPHLLSLADEALAQGYVSFVGAVKQYAEDRQVPFAAGADEKVRGDIHTLFRRTCRSWQREKQLAPAPEGEETQGVAEAGVPDFSERLADRAELIWAMQHLTGREREVLQMVCLEDRTQREAALRLGVSQQAVAKARKRALEKLRRILSAEAAARGS